MNLEFWGTVQTKAVSWIFDICPFANLGPKMMTFGQKSDRNRPKIWVKWVNIKNPRNKFCLYPKAPVSCKKSIILKDFKGLF